MIEVEEVEWDKIKKWFSQITDMDLDLTVSMGAINRTWIIEQYRKEMGVK